jgi:hypothetical protein
LLGIALLIPGLLRIPLPQIDFHNIRHHDGKGEICPHHDHLLRWHPTASHDKDVAMLHWHWLAPQSVQVNPPSGRETDGPMPRSGLALHAHLPDCTEPDWRADPVIRPESRRCGQSPVPSPSSFEIGTASLHFAGFIPLAAGPPGTCRGTSEKQGGDGLRLIERWNC